MARVDGVGLWQGDQVRAVGERMRRHEQMEFFSTQHCRPGEDNEGKEYLRPPAQAH
jgi:hypothetical protein